MNAQMSVTLETISPIKAKEYLATMIANNRSVKKFNLANIAADMASGRWRLNGEAIKFHGSNLVDGQHRLMACIDANVPFETLVVRGLEVEAVKVIDLGAKRQVGDVLHMFGESHFGSATTVAATARIVMSLQRQPDAPSKLVGRLSTSDIVAEVESRPGDYQNATLYGRRFRSWSNPSGAAALMIFAIKAGYTVEQLDEYHDKIQDGANLSKSDACLTYRNWVVNRPKRSYVDGFAYLSAHIKCFGADANGRALQKLFVWDGKSPYPTLERPAGVFDAHSVRRRCDVG